MREKITSLSNMGDVTDWLDLCRTSRQPQLLWYVDYIEPKPLMREVNELIRQSEIILYGNTTNLKMLPGFSADISQEIAFHTIRMHLRIEEGEFNSALLMLNQLMDEWYDRISQIRQSNLLVHACLIYLCMKEFNKSHQCFEKHWILTKYMSPSERVELGIWDNEVLLQLAYWFFCKHDKDFCDFYAVQQKLSSPASMWRHKKIPILNFLDYDHSWIVAFCSLSMYNHARTLMPGLPPYEKKSTTPVNRLYYIEQEHTVEERSKAMAGWEKYYFEKYNHENRSDHVADLDISDSYLYSYLHFHTDYDADAVQKLKLIKFIDAHKNWNEFVSVAEVGCGTSLITDFLPPNSNYVGVDIAEHICNIHQEKAKNVVHLSANKFFANTQNYYDLCFASDLLSHLSPYRLTLFLESCCRKCKYLVAGIDLLPDDRENILVRSSSPYMSLHLSLMNVEKWKEKIGQYFEIEHYDELGGQRLLVIAKSRVAM